MIKKDRRLSTLKGQRTRLLKKEIKTEKEFENTQSKLDEIEFKIAVLEQKNKKKG